MDLSDFILDDSMIDDEGNDREKIRKLENEVLLLKKEMMSIRLASKLEMSQKIEKNLRKEMMKKQAEYEKETKILLQKIAGLEKAKCLLQSDVEELNEDLEKIQDMNAKMMQKQAEYEEADSARRDAENRTLAELQVLRIEMERCLQEKEEEIENLRKNMQFEIDRLIATFADAEAQMKTEIPLLKKKYLAEIAELEMTIDNLNDANFEAHLTIKKQNEQIKVLKASLEDAAELKQGINKLTVEFKNNDDINAPKQQHCNNAYEEQFKELYEIDDDPERKKWLDDWFKFMAQNGKPVTRYPIMAKKVLDLYKLYNAVVKCGGIVEVINKKLWREITKALDLPNSITSAAFTLRSQYCLYLYDYECHQYNFSTKDALQMVVCGNK